MKLTYFSISLDPLIVYKPVSGCRQTYLQFSHNSDVVVVGDIKGEVSVYAFKNLPQRPHNQVRVRIYIL